MQIVRGRKLVCRQIGRTADFRPIGRTLGSLGLWRMVALLASVAALVLTAACSAPPTRAQGAASPPEASAAFRACYAKAKKPWLVDVVTIAQNSDARLDLLVTDLVGGTMADQVEARKYLGDRRSGRYANSAEMAARIFHDCMAATSTERHEYLKTVRCYKEQAILFELLWMKSEGGLDAEQASSQLLQRNSSAGGLSEGVIRRLTRDTYLLMKPGSGNASAFTEAQFQLCLTIYP